MNCKGSLQHGTACAVCVKCEIELAKLRNPKLPVITEEILNQWEAHASSLDLLAIVAMARVGLWTLNHSNAVRDSIKARMAVLSTSEISKYEMAWDSRPKELK